ncbi:unnamed protein product [Ixodes pacificus]
MLRHGIQAMSFYAIVCLFGSDGHHHVCDPEPKYYAWKVLANLENAYIKYTNYNETSRICMGVSAVTFKGCDVVPLFDFTFRAPGDSAIQTVPQYGKVGKHPDIIQFYDRDTGNLAAEYNVLYSNYTTCTVLRKTHSNQCRLRIKYDSSSADINECLQKFYPLCGIRLYDLYNEELCPA